MDPSNNKVLYAATYQRRRATWGFNGGGPGSAMWKSHRCRPHLDEADQRRARPGRSAASAWTSIAPTQHRLRAHRAREGERRLPLGRCRPDVAEDVGRQSAADVLQPDPHRSDERLAHLRARRRPPHLRRRRQDVLPAASAMHDDHHAMWINPNNPNHIIDGNDGGVGISYDKRARPSRASTTWTSGSSTTSPTTCRRRTTSAAACRTTTPGAARARCAAGRASATTTGVSIQGGDGFEAQIDPKRSAHRLRRVAGRQHRPHRSRHQRAQVDPPGAGEGRAAVSLELEHADLLISPHDTEHHLRRRQQGVQVDRPRPDTGRRSAPT